MNYTQFAKIINDGERYNVDFKVKCNAFYGKDNIASNAELAKDICAMANNGNIASYIIIGVSDDRKNFLSVSNPNLTDDALQNFCKKSISPPPKVRLSRVSFSKAQNPTHNGKEFLIIQVGPQQRKAFRLNTDFINYDAKVCFRHNEVWLRRNTISDLATPEEIARLVKGEPPIANDDIVQLQEERDNFQKLSISNKIKKINSILGEKLISDLNYKFIKIETHHKAGTHMQIFLNDEYTEVYKYFYKIVNDSVLLIRVSECLESLTKKELQHIDRRADKYFLHQEDIPSNLTKKLKVKDIPFRQLWIIPVLATIPKRRIQSSMQEWTLSGDFLHFYRQIEREPNHPQSSQLQIVPRSEITRSHFISSSEILVIDNISSGSEFVDKINISLAKIEVIKNLMIYPVNKH